jgi:hypothetical protein
LTVALIILAISIISLKKLRVCHLQNIEKGLKDYHEILSYQQIKD